MISTSKENSIFLLDVNDKKITFRTARNPQHLQKEKYEIDGDMVYLNIYHFHKNYLEKFIEENK